MNKRKNLFFFLTYYLHFSFAFPESGKWTLHFNETQEFGAVAKNLFNQTNIYIRIECLSETPTKIKIGWILRETKCWNEYLFLQESQRLQIYYSSPGDGTGEFPFSPPFWAKYEETTYDCNQHIVLTVQKDIQIGNGSQYGGDSLSVNHAVFVKGPNDGSYSTNQPQFMTDHEGNYVLVLHISRDGVSSFNATVNIDMKSEKGYLSPIDWPLLPFYAVMCAVYVLLALTWFILCARQWRDLLSIQFWIANVIFLGMLEKAMFLAEFQSINGSGKQVVTLILIAELVSSGKRTLARMLVIIVSLGFGIVKPRLGSTLHRVAGIGCLYLSFAFVEAWLRVVKPKNDISSTNLMAGIPLAIIDSSISWWVFSALVQTTRTLRLRRNLVKLSLYRRFTHVLIIAVISSVIFMLWNIKEHRIEDCLSEWQNLWIDDAYWHILFSFLLIVIMILWAPSKNNQRYAFSPLLDDEEDEISEDEEFYTDAYEGMTMRYSKSSDSARGTPRDTEEDALKWIEANIPQSENPLPILDSEEEIETTKFEISKMQ